MSNLRQSLRNNRSSAPQTSNCSLFTSHVFYISFSDWSAMEHSSTAPSKFTQVWFLELEAPDYYLNLGHAAD